MRWHKNLGALALLGMAGLAACAVPPAPVAEGPAQPPGQTGTVLTIRTDQVGADQDGAVAQIMGALNQPAATLPASATEVIVKLADGSTKILIAPGTDPSVDVGQSVWVSPGPDYQITSTR